MNTPETEASQLLFGLFFRMADLIVSVWYENGI
jgi:hypothetical protein